MKNKMGRRIAAIILCMMMLLTSDSFAGFVDAVEAATASDAEILYSGTSGDLDWSITSDGSLTISGEGDYALDYYDSKYLPAWLEYTDSFTSAAVIVSRITSTEYMFYGCENLTELDLTNLDTSNVADMSLMFFDCSSLSSLDLSHFDTSNVTSMEGMFESCSGLSSLDLSNFDTSNVVNMGFMFFDCSGLTSLDVSHFDTSNVTDMSNMFYRCEGLTDLDVSNFDTSNVTDMSGMFDKCSGLTSLDVSNFDTSNVTDMSGMFETTSSLTSLDIDNFDTSNVTDMRDMFAWCFSLENLDVSNFDTSNVTDMRWMFYYCYSLTSLDISNFDTSNVTEIESVFDNCTGLTNLTIPAEFIEAVDLPAVSGYYWTDEDGTVCTTVTARLSAAMTYTRHEEIHDLSEANITLSATSYTYDGTAKTPTVTVTYDGTVLTRGTDYTVSYSNNTSVGTAAVTITGTGNYTGTVKKTFSIGEKGISGATVTLSKSSYTYTGSACKPTVTVKLSVGGSAKTLISGTDYTVSYSNNKNAGTATVTITGKGNYSGTLKKTFTINAKSVSGLTATLSKTTYTYTGSACKPTVTVKYTVNGSTKTLKSGTDYTVSYSSNKNAGTATVTITGKGNYKGTLKKTFTIKAKSVSGLTATLSKTTYTYTGSACKPTVTVKYTVNGSTKTLKSGTDYTVSYSSNKNAGTATVTITGKGNYTGNLKKTFTIKKASQSVTASAKSTSLIAGNTTTITAKASAGGKLTYSSADTSIAKVSSSGKITAVGYGTVKITVKAAATDNYKAANKTITIRVTLAQPSLTSVTNDSGGVSIAWKSVTGATKYRVYRKIGSSGPWTKLGDTTSTGYIDKTAKTGTMYYYTVACITNSGTVASKYSTTGKKTVRLSVASLSSVTNSSSNKMTVKWEKSSDNTGYQIEYSTSSTFDSGIKTVAITDASTTNKVISGLKKGKTYYVRIRTYKMVDGARYYSAWSAAKSVKISK